MTTQTRQLSDHEIALVRQRLAEDFPFITVDCQGRVEASGYWSIYSDSLRGRQAAVGIVFCDEIGRVASRHATRAEHYIGGEYSEGPDCWAELDANGQPTGLAIDVRLWQQSPGSRAFA